MKMNYNFQHSNVNVHVGCCCQQQRSSDRGRRPIESNSFQVERNAVQAERSAARVERSTVQAERYDGCNHKKELEELRREKESTEKGLVKRLNATSQESLTKSKEIQALKSQVAKKEQEIRENKGTILQLKNKGVFEQEKLTLEMEAVRAMKENAENELMAAIGKVRKDNQELQAAKSQIAQKDQEICKTKGTVRQLKRKLRKEKGEVGKKLAALAEEKMTLEKELSRKAREESSEAQDEEEKRERIRALEIEVEKLKEGTEDVLPPFLQVRAIQIEIEKLKAEVEMKEDVEKKMAALEEANEEVEEEKRKLEESFAASLIQGDNEMHRKLEERMERIRMLEIEAEKLKEENKELKKDETSSSSQILLSEYTETNEEGVNAEEISEEEAVEPQRGEEVSNENLCKSRPRKRQASENLLVSQRKSHEMFCKIIESGLSQLIEDEDTPATMLGSLRALKQYTTSSSEDAEPPQAKRMKLQNIPKVQKQEYFEYDEIKREPVENGKSTKASEQ